MQIKYFLKVFLPFLGLCVVITAILVVCATLPELVSRWISRYIFAAPKEGEGEHRKRRRPVSKTESEKLLFLLQNE